MLAAISNVFVIVIMLRQWNVWRAEASCMFCCWVQLVLYFKEHISSVVVCHLLLWGCFFMPKLNDSLFRQSNWVKVKIVIVCKIAIISFVSPQPTEHTNLDFPVPSNYVNSSLPRSNWVFLCMYAVAVKENGSFPHLSNLTQSSTCWVIYPNHHKHCTNRNPTKTTFDLFLCNCHKVFHPNEDLQEELSKASGEEAQKHPASA